MLTRIVLMLFLFSRTINVIIAQNLQVLHVGGGVSARISGKQVALKASDIITKSTELTVPYEGTIDIIDIKDKKRYVIKRVGKGTVEELVKVSGNSVSEITARYVIYVQKQMTNRELVSAQRYSDFATVTRMLDSVHVEKEPLTMREIFEDAKRRNREVYNAFRIQCNKKYTDFVRKAWDRYEASPILPTPQDQNVKPVVYDEQTAKARISNSGWKKEYFSSRSVSGNVSQPNVSNNVVRFSELSQSAIMSKKQPQPTQPIREVEVDKELSAFQCLPFTFLGLDLQVRIDASQRVNIGKLTPEHVADVLDRFSEMQYDNLLFDCLKLRNEKKLCDWAYLLMLKTLSEQFCGQKTNESTLLMGFLYWQSGYKVRFAYRDDNLFLLVGTEHRIYDKSGFMIDGTSYYAIDDIPEEVYISPVCFEKEKGLSLFIPRQMNIKSELSEERTIKGKSAQSIDVKIKSDKTLLGFYASYPSSCINDNFMTRWAMYANTPLSDNVKNQLYPVIKENIKGLSDLEAVNRLLDFFHNGLEYEYDDVVWGGDRVFFAEETLYYPFCDCEDRSILLTRLVRDLLGLQCVLVYYPGHLACAIHFKEDVEGDAYVLDGIPYVVADPTYIGANVGKEMPLKNNTPTLILLEN